MDVKYLNINGAVIALLDDGIINNTADALDLIGTASYNDSSRVIIPMEHLTPDFFVLRTRIAGDILQKCVNYGVRVAIVGDFSVFSSKSLADFIRESNKGRQVFFKTSVDEAADTLAALDD